MDTTKLLTDIIKAVSDAQPLPDFTDRVSIKAFAAKLVPDLIDAGFDTAGLQAAHAECCAMAPADLETKIKAADQVGAIGDGTILKWLVANLPSIIQMVLLFVPKTAAPVA